MALCDGYCRCCDATVFAWGCPSSVFNSSKPLPLLEIRLGRALAILFPRRSV